MDVQRGRGRGRGRIQKTNVVPEVGNLNPPEPSLSPNETVLENTSSLGTTQATTVQRTASSSRGRGRVLPKTSGSSSDYAMPPPPQIASEPDQSDQHYCVSDLTRQKFFSTERPGKPQESHDFEYGAPVTVATNYFAVSNHSNEGVIHRYHVSIKHIKSGEEVHRDRRRAIYNIWLTEYLKLHPDINKHLIVFDSVSMMATLNCELPDINEQGISFDLRAPNKSNQMSLHQVIVQKTGEPIPLSVLDQINSLDHHSPNYKQTVAHLSLVKQYLTFAMTQSVSNRSQFIFGRTFFTLDDRAYDTWNLGSGNALWRGFYSCLVFSKDECRLLMNLDVKHMVFRKKQSFLDFLCEVMMKCPSATSSQGRRDPRQHKVDFKDVCWWLDSKNPQFNLNKRYLDKICKHIRVRSQNADKPIVYTIEKLGSTANEQNFIYKESDNREISVNDYYAERYGFKLKYPGLPLLSMTKKKTYLPMELVDIEPARMKKISDDELAAVCRYSTMNPDVYAQSIQKLRRDPNKMNFDNDPFIQAWKLNVDVNMLQIPACVLPTPVIRYKQSEIPSNSARKKGNWDSTKQAFFEPQNFPRVWAMFNISALSDGECYEFYRELIKTAATRGMRCENEPIFINIGDRCQPEEVTEIVRDCLDNNPECRFCLIILPGGARQNQTYKAMKALLEKKLDDFGVPSQMIKQQNAKKGSKRNPSEWESSKMDNILLKINPKLNGTNHVISVPSNIESFFQRGHRIMYVGIDLSHLSVSRDYRLSAVAVVGSADDVPNRYFKEIYQQKRSTSGESKSLECVICLKDIMKSLLQKYETYRHYPPTAIMIYRDGISTGEFESVFVDEITAVREACIEISPSYRPYLTYIVVNKRHSTRFFPATNNSKDNVESGTVVDSHSITNPLTFDFFLNSQHGALGTSRPTHYHVLYDDNKLAPKQVQMITYALCFMHARCTKAIAIPAPVKYADLLAYRVSLYLNADHSSDTASESSHSSSGNNSLAQRIMGTISEPIELSSKLLPELPFFI